MPVDPLDAFPVARPRFLSVAYRMTGGRSDAEDVVQQVWLRWQTACGRPGAMVLDPFACSTRVATRLTLDTS